MVGFSYSYIGNTQEISYAKFGKGLFNFVSKDSSFSVKFAPRIQSRYEVNWDHNGDTYDSGEQNFSIRRARLRFVVLHTHRSLNTKLN